MAGTPFESIESAQEFVRLLVSEVEEARGGVEIDTAEATRDRATRRVDALHIVNYKLKQLEQHLRASGRILNDLRLLRRLLVGEQDPIAAISDESLRKRPPQAVLAAPKVST